MFKRNFLYMMAIWPALVATSAKAFCPICTVAVVSGVGLSRWLKIDDTITGLWIGGMIVSLIGWTINWCRKKNIRFRGLNLSIVLAYYAIVVLPLYFYEIVGHPLNKFWGIDKLLLGIILGSILFLGGYLWYLQIKKSNQNQALFPFQKIVMPVAPLIVLSIIFYFLTR